METDKPHLRIFVSPEVQWTCDHCKSSPNKPTQRVRIKGDFDRDDLFAPKIDLCVHCAELMIRKLTLLLGISV